jgi:hypothetical protein
LELLDIALVVTPSAIFLWHVPHIGRCRLKAAALLAQATARVFAAGETPLKISEAVGRSEPRLFRALFPGWIEKSHAVFPDIHDKNRSEFVRRLNVLACVRLFFHSFLCLQSMAQICSRIAGFYQTIGHVSDNHSCCSNCITQRQFEQPIFGV